MRKLKCKTQNAKLKTRRVVATVFGFAFCVLSFEFASAAFVLPTFPPLEFHPPTPERWVMANGLVVYLLEDHELPLIKASILFHAGTQYDPADEVGVGSIFGSVWTDGGTLTEKPDDIEKLLERRSASVFFSMDQEKASGEFSCRTQDFPSVFGIFTDLLLHPLFRKDHLSLEKSKAQESLRRLNDDPENIGRREFRKLIYGPTHPSARIPTPESIDRIKREDLQAIHARYIHPNTAVLAISGDFKTDALKAQLTKAFAAWPPHDVTYPFIAPVTAVPQRSLYYIQKEIDQTQIRIGHVGFARRNPDHFAWEIFNELWGGSSTSILFRTVRTELGLAYDVGSTFSEPNDKGLIVAIAQTRGSKTIASVQAILKLTSDASQAAFTHDAVQNAKDAVRNRFVENYNSSFKIVSEIADLDYFGYSSDYLNTYTTHVDHVSENDLKRVAKTYLHPDQATILVVGDLSTFEKPLATLGKPQEIKPDNYAENSSFFYPTVH